jgi:Major Facilitator Superfamily.
MLLVFGRMISDTGTGIQAVIMPLYIIDIGGSAATIGLFSFLSLVPALIVYPFAGVLGDRSNRKTITVVTDLISGILLLGLAYAAYSGQMGLTLLLSVQVLVALLYGFFDPATKGMLPQLVPQDALTRANSTLVSARILSAMLSPVIGAALYAGLGIFALILLNGISFIISAGSSMLIRYRHFRHESALGVSGLLNDLSEGTRFIRNNKAIRQLCGFFSGRVCLDPTDIRGGTAPVFQDPSGIFRHPVRLSADDNHIGSHGGKHTGRRNIW